MPNLPDWTQVIRFFQDHYKCTFEEAREKAKQERARFQSGDKRSRIEFCHKNKCWKGRKAQVAYEKFGNRRPGDNPASLRNTIIREVGGAYLSTQEVNGLFIRLFSEEQAESKFKQARSGPCKMIVKSKTYGVWHLPTTPPPRSVTDTMNRSARRVYFIGLYGEMHRLMHSPGEKFVQEDSGVFQYILEKNGRPGDWEFAKAEFNRIRQFRSKKTGKNGVLIYDSATREWMGCLTQRAEQPAPVA